MTAGFSARATLFVFDDDRAGTTLADVESIELDVVGRLIVDVDRSVAAEGLQLSVASVGDAAGQVDVASTGTHFADQNPLGFKVVRQLKIGVRFLLQWDDPGLASGASVFDFRRRGFRDRDLVLGLTALDQPVDVDVFGRNEDLVADQTR